MEWALRDLFLAYIDRLKRSAREGYDHDVLVWAILAAAGAKGIKKPEPPAVLNVPKLIVGGGS